MKYSPGQSIYQTSYKKLMLVINNIAILVMAEFIKNFLQKDLMRTYSFSWTNRFVTLIGVACYIICFKYLNI